MGHLTPGAERVHLADLVQGSGHRQGDRVASGRVCWASATVTFLKMFGEKQSKQRWPVSSLKAACKTEKRSIAGLQLLAPDISRQPESHG